MKHATWKLFASFGAGRLVGTHRIGNDKTTSVVDARQYSHDHPNLWIAGSGSFPTPRGEAAVAPLRN